MSVAARFWVQNHNRQAVAGGVMTEVKLAPVIRPSQLPGGDGNVEWSKHTPSGSITLMVSNEAAAAWFGERLGKDIAITFADPADAE